LTSAAQERSQRFRAERPIEFAIAVGIAQHGTRAP
jgi:hypothetical protein